MGGIHWTLNSSLGLLRFPWCVGLAQWGEVWVLYCVLFPAKKCRHFVKRMYLYFPSTGVMLANCPTGRQLIRSLSQPQLRTGTLVAGLVALKPAVSAPMAVNIFRRSQEPSTPHPPNAIPPRSHAGLERPRSLRPQPDASCSLPSEGFPSVHGRRHLWVFSSLARLTGLPAHLCRMRPLGSCLPNSTA